MKRKGWIERKAGSTNIKWNLKENFCFFFFIVVFGGNDMEDIFVQ